MKRLISLIGAIGLFFGSTTAQENNLEYQKKVFSQLGIPKRFIGYEKFLTGGGITEMNDDFLVHIFYDINGDEKADVMEYREISSISEDGKVTFEDETVGYWFDLNNNDKTDGEELFWDYRKDGLNGNEERTSIWED